MKRITVREITERAEINKTTFYLHYETLPDLIDTLEMDNINYIVENLDQVQLLFDNPDLFIDDLYRNLQDCRISIISRNGAGNNSFIDKLKATLEKEMKSRNIDTTKYDDVISLLIFILHGLLGIVNMENDNFVNLEVIKEFVRNGLKTH
jgi:AcrR family transcriptional regulator